MKEKLEKCPLCGAKVVDAYNSITKQFYYKCENSGCHFRLPKNYTEQEVSLQGIELKAECGGCGSPLTIACGPNGLYATCLRCNYDLRPNMVYGFVFKNSKLYQLNDTKSYLGRPWYPSSAISPSIPKLSFIDCNLYGNIVLDYIKMNEHDPNYHRLSIINSKLNDNLINNVNEINYDDYIDKVLKYFKVK